MSQKAPQKKPDSEDVVADLTRVLSVAREGDPVIALLEARATGGEKTYGMRLQTHTGRDKTSYLLAVWRDLAAIERQVRWLRMAAKGGAR